jgi:hypothetical protein
MALQRLTPKLETKDEFVGTTSADRDVQRAGGEAAASTQYRRRSGKVYALRISAADIELRMPELRANIAL